MKLFDMSEFSVRKFHHVVKFGIFEVDSSVIRYIMGCLVGMVEAEHSECGKLDQHFRYFPGPGFRNTSKIT